MAKAVFYLSGPKAQHEGNRLLMASKMIEFGFEKGAVFNLPDGRVEVLLGGQKEKIERFHATAKRDFVEWVKAKAKDQEAVKEQIGNPGIKLTDLDFDDNLLVHKLEIYGHSLTFDQIYKGVDIFKELNKTNKRLNKTYEEFKEVFKEVQSKNTEVLQTLLTEFKNRTSFGCLVI